MKKTFKTIRIAGFLLLTAIAFASCGSNDSHDHEKDGHEHHDHEGEKGHEEHDH